MASAITNYIVLMILLGGILVGRVVGVGTEIGEGVGTETGVGTTVEVVVVVATMKAVRVYRKRAGIYHYINCMYQQTSLHDSVVAAQGHSQDFRKQGTRLRVKRMKMFRLVTIPTN